MKERHTRRTALRRLAAAVVACWLVGLQCTAAEGDEVLEEVKERMKRNLPKVEKLKKEGKVGENNRGYLHPLTKLTQEEEQLVKRENEDRKIVYTYLARQAGVSVEEVEKARAKQIRERSAPGIWLQAPDGKWYKKEG